MNLHLHFDRNLLSCDAEELFLFTGPSANAMTDRKGKPQTRKKMFSSITNVLSELSTLAG